MDPITQQTVLAAAGAGGDPVYVDDVFSTTVYTGTGGSSRSVVTGIDNTEKSLLWVKSRQPNSRGHALYDTERGAGIFLSSDGTFPNSGSVTDVTAFNSNGFTTRNDSGQVNGSNETYVAWNFKAAPGFFDVVTYTGTGSARTVAHSLGSVPGMVLIKCTSHTSDWSVYHRSLGATKNMHLNNTSAADTQTGVFNDTEPTSTHFTLNYDGDVNGSGKSYVAYIFAHDDAQFGTDEDESIIKCGSYAGNNTGGLHTVNVGFEPQFVLIKNTTTNIGGGGDWQIIDAMRGAADNGIDQAVLAANLSSSEPHRGIRLFVTNEGFGWRDQAGNDVSGGGNTFTYMAIRRPHKPPEAATEVFAMDTHTGSIPNYISGFPVDFVIKKDGINSSGDVHVASRIQGRKFLKTNSTEAEGNAFVAAAFDHSNGFASGSGSSPDSEYLAWMFKRAPGFMDVVTYNGTGSTRTINHHLGAVPEMMVIKSRDEARSYQIYHAALGAGYYHPGFRTDPFYTSSSRWDTTPTSTVFSVKTDTDLNSSNGQGYIAYLFATLPGISKVGSYTGTGNAINVDCGFTAGARFILIKRTDTEIGGTPGTSWFLWDSVRGIVSGNDPYLLLNRDNNGVDAQVTNTDYIDPLSSGFTVTSSAPAVLNASGATYVFLAIA